MFRGYSRMHAVVTVWTVLDWMFPWIGFPMISHNESTLREVRLLFSAVLYTSHILSRCLAFASPKADPGSIVIEEIL